MYVVTSIGFRRITKRRGASVDLLTEAVAICTHNDFSSLGILSYKQPNNLDIGDVIDDETLVRAGKDMLPFLMKLIEWVSAGATLVCWSHNQSIAVIKHNLRTFKIPYNKEWFDNVVDLRTVIANKYSIVDVSSVTLNFALCTSDKDYSSYREQSKYNLCNKLRLLAHENAHFLVARGHESDITEFRWKEIMRTCPKCFSALDISHCSTDKNCRISQANCVVCRSEYMIEEMFRLYLTDKIMYQTYIKELDSTKNDITNQVCVGLSNMN